MSRYHGGERVDGGFYLDLDHWAVKTVSGRRGVLDGPADTTYLRVPTLTVLALAPLMGAAYVVFLPFAGIAMVLQHLGRKAYAVAEDAAHATLASVSPAWRPGEAHFAGPDEKKAEETREVKPDAQVEDRLKALDDEVERRARDER